MNIKNKKIKLTIACPEHGIQKCKELNILLIGCKKCFSKSKKIK